MIKFPPIETPSPMPYNIIYIINGIFGEENAIDYIYNIDNSSVRIYFNQSLPMTDQIIDFYANIKNNGKMSLHNDTDNTLNKV